MGSQDQLLLDELQQLGHMVQVLSYELTVLQDFMKENYGPRFDSYRKTHLNSQPNTTQLSSRIRVSVSSTESSHHLRKGSKIKVEATTQRNADDGDDCISINEEDQEDDDNEAHHSNQEDNFSSKSIQMDDNVVADKSEERDPLGAYVDESIDNDDNYQQSDKQKEGILPRGKPKNAIWKQYIVSKLSNGRIQAKCRKCLNCVSSKVDRLTGHYQKCVLGIRKRKKSSTEELGNKRRVSRRITSESRKSTTESPNRWFPRGGGRKLDPVWSYFNVKEDEGKGGKKTATCKTCSLEVSCKADRVRKHFILCNELDKDMGPEPKGSRSESDDS